MAVDIEAKDFENYQIGVYDAAVMGIFDGDRPREQEFVFPQGVLDFPVPDDNPWRKRDLFQTRSEGLVNGLTVVRSAGSDGEIDHGAVEVLHIQTPEGEVSGVIRSSSSQNLDGMPNGDRTWVCEFSDFALLERFMTESGWKLSFNRASLMEALKEFGSERDIHDIGKSGPVQLYSTGFLKPWYHRVPGDFLFADGRFATDGAAICDAFARHDRVPGFETGRVYKHRVFDEDGRLQEKFVTRTCLAAFRITRDPTNMLSTRDTSKDVMMQWSDGELMHFQVTEARDFRPRPLKPEELALALDEAS